MKLIMNLIKLNAKRRIVLVFSLLGLFIFIMFVFPYTNYKFFNYYSDQYMFNDLSGIPEVHTGLILGARVFQNNRISHILYDRVIAGAELYKNKKVSKLLVSGDHGRTDYDEVNTMKFHLLNNQIKGKDIFLDHAGFDTYDSIIRAIKVFGVRDVIIVSQRFHLPRAIYIARQNGLNAFGYVADKRQYANMRSYKIREMYARVKALLEVVFDSSPKYLGKEISIFGDGRESWD